VKKIKLSAKARADLDTIWLYVAERDGAQAADRLIDRLAETFPLLAAFPRMGKPREDVLPDTRVSRWRRISSSTGGGAATSR
jgi:toxin ParE1/3/4